MRRENNPQLRHDGRRPPAAARSCWADRKIYVATMPNTRELGGAMGVFDPATGKVRNYNLIPNQSICAWRMMRSQTRLRRSSIAGGGGITQ